MTGSKVVQGLKEALSHAKGEAPAIRMARDDGHGDEMNDHDFLPPDSRCCHCGTLASDDYLRPQPCPGRPMVETIQPTPSQPRGEVLRPAPFRRELVADDFDTIGRRLAELAGERTAAMNEARKE